MITYIGILAAIFVAMTVGTISFAFWDRRTIIRPFETKVAALDERIIENREKNEKLVTVLKEKGVRPRKRGKKKPLLSNRFVNTILLGRGFKLFSGQF